MNLTQAVEAAVGEVVAASSRALVVRWIAGRCRMLCVVPARCCQQIPYTIMRVHTSLFNCTTSCSRTRIRSLSRSRSSSICSRSSAAAPSSSRFSAVLCASMTFTSSHSFPRTSYSVVVSPGSRPNGGSTAFCFPFAFAESLGSDGTSSASKGQ